MIKNIRYTKDNGEVSERKIIPISEPRKNMLALDVSHLDEKEVKIVLETLKEIEKERDEAMYCLALADLIKWRTFKPEGIEYINRV